MGEHRLAVAVGADGGQRDLSRKRTDEFGVYFRVLQFLFGPGLGMVGGGGCGLCGSRYRGGVGHGPVSHHLVRYRSQRRPHPPPPPPLAGVLGLPVLGLLLLFAANDLPALADPGSPAHVHISPVYLQQSYADTLTVNVVTSVLMDYRAFDTLIETVVIFASGIACALLLRENGS